MQSQMKAQEKHYPELLNRGDVLVKFDPSEIVINPASGSKQLNVFQSVLYEKEREKNGLLQSQIKDLKTSLTGLQKDAKKLEKAVVVKDKELQDRDEELRRLQQKQSHSSSSAGRR